MDLFGGAQQAAERFRKIPGIKDKVVRLVGNLDTDGLSATGILAKALMREQIKFATLIIKQVDEKILHVLKNEHYEVIFFLDLGSGHVKHISEVFKQRHVFILDHHYPESFDAYEGVVHVNPHLFGLDGTKDISAAGVVYFFAKALSEGNIDLSYLALLGAVGDVQENNGFTGLNEAILQDAIISKKIVVEEGVRLYGISTKPLCKVLEYSTNPYIVGVTGSEEGAIKFLKNLGINYRSGLSYTRYADLSKEEVKKLVSAIMMNKINPEEGKIENVYGPVYLVQGEEDDLPTRDLHEFSTLLNCCGRLGRSSLGIGTCLGDLTLKEKAVHLMREYQQEIIGALQWFYSVKKTELVIEGGGVVIVNAGDYVNEHIIGVLTSLISKSLVYREGDVVIGMARAAMGNETKVSLRVSGFKGSEIDLRVLVKRILEKTGGSGGGHSLAAGAFIPQEKEQEFIQAVREFFSKVVVDA